MPLSMSRNVREETANVALSQIIEEYGMSNVSLVHIDGNIPDIYLVERGVRVIIEMKKEGNRNELVRQIGDRLDEGICDIVFGVVFPSEVTEGGISAPSTLQVKQNLRECQLSILIQPFSSDTDIIQVDASISELPELVSRHAGEALNEEELDSAVERVSDSIESFVDYLVRHPNSESVSTDIEEVLEGVE